MTVTTAPPDPARPSSYYGAYMAVGRVAEELALRWLRELAAGVAGALDVREDQDCQRDEIDFRAYMADGRTLGVEVKSNSLLGVGSGVVFELLGLNIAAPARDACTLGWSARSRADLFCYYAPAVHRLYVCRANSLRAALQRYERGQVALKWVPTDQVKSTLVAIIPWRPYCERVFRVYELPEEWKT